MQASALFSERPVEPPPWNPQVQAKGGGHRMATPSMDEVARGGINGAGAPLPYLSQIQRAFGRHDLSDVVAHTDASAQKASLSLGAAAYTRGNHVAFGSRPSLHTAAHEAAHTVQQRSGLKLAGGVGRQGDAHEKHADAVADRVVRGESTEALLDAYAAPAGSDSGSRPGGAARPSPAIGVQLKKLTDEEKKAIVGRFESLYFTVASGKRTPKPDVSSSDAGSLLSELLTQYNPDEDSFFFTDTLESVAAEHRAALRGEAPQDSKTPSNPPPSAPLAVADSKLSAPTQDDVISAVHKILNNTNRAFATYSSSSSASSSASSPSGGSKTAQQPVHPLQPAPKLSKGDQQALEQAIRMLRCQVKLHFAMVDLIAGSTKTGANAGMLLADIFSFGISTVGTVPARAAMAAALMAEHTARSVTSAKLFNDINQMTPSQLIAVGLKSMDWPLKSPYFYELASAITSGAAAAPIPTPSTIGYAVFKQAAVSLTSEATEAFADYLGDITGAAVDFIPGADLVGGGVKITKAGFQVKTYTEEIEQLRKQMGK